MKRSGHHHTARHRSTEEHSPEIGSVPLYGTTWYTGGPAYWLRRAVASLLILVFVALFAGIDGIFVASFFGFGGHRPDPAPGSAVLGIVIAVSIAGFVWSWNRMGRMETYYRERVKDFTEGMLFGYAWTGLGWVVLILVVVGLVASGVVRQLIGTAIALLVGLAFFGIAAFLPGPLLAVFVKSITSEPQTVRDARRDLDEWYLLHGHDSAEPVRPT